MRQREGWIMRAIAVCFVALVAVILFAQHRGGPTGQISPAVNVIGAPLALNAPEANEPSDQSADGTLARLVADTVKSGSADRARVEAAQSAASPTLLAYEKLVSLRMNVSSIADQAATCGLRSRKWQAAVDQRADYEMRNGELPEDLRSKMTIDEVFAAEAYGNYMKPFFASSGLPDRKECEGIFGVGMTPAGPREFFANKVDRYGRGEGQLFESLD